MSIYLIIFIVIHVLVLAYTVEMLRRTVHKHNEYPLEENRDSLPFGFVKLRHIIVMYFVSYLIWVGFSIWLYTFFVGDIFPGSATGINNAILNL